MRKKISWLFVIFICLGIMKVQVWANEVPEEERKGTELLVLIDNSGSIETNEQSKKEFEWAENICAYMQGTGITLKYLWFDGGKDLYENEKLDENRIIDGSNLKNCIEELQNKVNHDGQYTDLAKAIDNAQEYFEKSSNAKNQYILLLSDGRIDLDGNRSKLDSEKIEDLRNDLNDKVNNFLSSNKKGKRGIVLTSLEDEDINEIYGEIKGKEIICELLDKDLADIMKAIKSIFELMDIPIMNWEQEQQDTENGKFSFNVEEKCSRAIINIRTELEGISLQNISMEIKDENNKIVEPNNIDRLEHSAYVYLNNPETGEYVVTLPEGTYTYNTIYQDYYDLESVELIILNGNDEKQNKEEQNKEAEYELLDEDIKKYEIKGDNFILGVKLNDGIEAERYNYIVKYYAHSLDKEENINLIDLNKKMEEDFVYKDYKVSDNSENSSVIELGDLPLSKGKYAVKLKIVSGENICFSNMVIVDVLGKLEPASISEPTIQLQIGEEHLLSNIIKNLEMKGDSEQEQIWTMVISQRKNSHGTMEDMEIFVKIGEDKEDNEFLDITEDTICFKKDGTYKAEIQDKAGNVVKIVEFEVSEVENTNLNHRVIVLCCLGGLLFFIILGCVFSKNK